MTETVHKVYILFFFAAGIAVTLFMALYGFQYYSLPVEERFFNSLHDSLKPSGLIGHGTGIAGTLMMILGVAIYMIRKRVKALHRAGYLKYWLEFHIFLCTAGPVLVLYHTAFKFGGIVSVSFWSMAAVVVSGFIGRFIYLQIPRRISGQEMSLQEIAELDSRSAAGLSAYPLSKKYIEELNKHSSTSQYKLITFSQSLNLMIKNYFTSGALLRKLKKQLEEYSLSKKEKKEIIKLSRTRLTLSHRVGLLRTSQKLFKYWHIIHLPFAIIMFIIMVIHVVITITFGYKWIF